MSTRESRPGEEAAPKDLAADHLQRNGHNGHEPSRLRAALEAGGGSLKSLTVLAPQNDPFRVDTDAGHRDGAWLADTLARLGITGQRHLRGLHYVLIGQPKPNGQPYTNTDSDWVWLASVAKAARWNGYIPFDRIVDQRNDQPIIRRRPPVGPEAFVSVDFEVIVPDADDLAPKAGLDGFVPVQPYRLVIVGEKSSLRPVLDPIANRYAADLYLPTGEISDTQVYQMASDGAADGRPMVVLYFADCDPAGWQMAISVSRKLQALIALEFGDLDVEVHRVALTPEQVREYGSPSTPLKDTERRADKWTAAMGVEQTEIDALAALQPDVLTQMARDAIGPFYDNTLSRRIRAAAEQWQADAQQAIDAQSGEQLEELRITAGNRLAEMRDRIEEILDEIHIDADQFDLPDLPDLPAAELDGDRPDPLLDGRWDFAEQCWRLIASKNYDGEMGGW
ncbi:MAG TPA: hypothetical protein VLL82_06205 [Mycobacterium sp.]|nr:hypothetical protein [Mycobacterium sp.]